MNKSIWDCTLDEILDSFIPESECPHTHRICFDLKSGKRALECPACGQFIKDIKSYDS